MVGSRSSNGARSEAICLAWVGFPQTEAARHRRLTLWAAAKGNEEGGLHFSKHTASPMRKGPRSGLLQQERFGLDP